MAFTQVAHLVLEIFNHGTANSPYPSPIVNLLGMRTSQHQRTVSRQRNDSFDVLAAGHVRERFAAEIHLAGHGLEVEQEHKVLPAVRAHLDSNALRQLGVEYP